MPLNLLSVCLLVSVLAQVHVHPKRFPAAYNVDWWQRVLAHTHQYVVVDKPAGVQVRCGLAVTVHNTVGLAAR